MPTSPRKVRLFSASVCSGWAEDRSISDAEDAQGLAGHAVVGLHHAAPEIGGQVDLLASPQRLRAAGQQFLGRALDEADVTRVSSMHGRHQLAVGVEGEFPGTRGLGNLCLDVEAGLGCRHHDRAFGGVAQDAPPVGLIGRQEFGIRA